MKFGILRYWLFLIVFTSLSSFAQNNECENILMQEVKVIEAHNITYKGVDIKKGQVLSIQQEVPLRIDYRFFECNQLKISEGGKLQFYDQNKKAIRLLRYVDSADDNRTFQSERMNNSVSRDDGFTTLNYCDSSGVLNSEFHATNLTNSKIHINNYDCFQIYFNHQDYFQFTSDTLVFKPDDFYIKGLLFEASNGQEHYFLKKNNNIIIDSDNLPEEDSVRIFLINMDGSASLLANYNYINLGKIIKRLSSENHSVETVDKVIRQVYLHSLENQLTDSDLKHRFHERLKNIVQENQKH